MVDKEVSNAIITVLLLPDFVWISTPCDPLKAASPLQSSEFGWILSHKFVESTFVETMSVVIMRIYFY